MHSILIANTDFVAIWKAASIVLTGLFGILGLVTEFKNKKTGKITKSGWASLVGIIISTTLGFAAQLIETANDQKHTSDTLLEIKKSLSPITQPLISAGFEVQCTAQYVEFCNLVKSHPGSVQPADLAKWPYPNKVIFLDLNFFAQSSVADKDFEDRKGIPNILMLPVPDWEVQVRVLLGGPGMPPGLRAFNELNTQKVFIAFEYALPVFNKNSGNIRSVPELKTAALNMIVWPDFVLYPAPSLVPTPTNLEIHFGNGETVDVQQDGFQVAAIPNGFRAKVK